MPEMSGHQLLEFIRKIDTEIPVIIFISDDTADAKNKALSLGATLVLAKPFEVEDVAKALNDVLAAPLKKSI